MMVRILPARAAGTGRPLGVYILDLQHERAGERLGAYLPKPEGEKVEWARSINTGVDDPRWAITAIEKYNAQNLRAHRVSRWVHIVVSFPDGERPTRQQMATIEDRLMEAIGFGDHPRLSAVHSNTRDSPTGGYRHLHIAVSRIDPTTLKAEHPRFNHFALQAEAARLEIDLGLRQERKTLLGRERREIDERVALDRAIITHHQPPADFYPEGYFEDPLEREMRGYFDALGRRGAEAAHAAGVTKEAIMSGLVGIARIRPVGELWEPDPQGTVAFVTPVRVESRERPHDIESPHPARAVRDGEIIDIIAWHPSRPDTWVLRTGDAAALGAAQYRLVDEAPAAPQVHNTPLAWLRAGGTGIVVLTSDPAERRLILGEAGHAEQHLSHTVDLDGLAELDRRAPAAQLDGAAEFDRQGVDQGARSTASADAPFQDMKREAIDRAIWADKVQSGLRPLMVEDVARMLEPEYAALIKRASELREQVAKEERSRNAMELNKLAAAYRIEERRSEIGFVRRFLHDLGTRLDGNRFPRSRNILRDLELHRWERMRGGATYMEDNKGIKQGAAAGELAQVTRLANSMLDPAHPLGQKLRPSGLTLRQEAERELRLRQQIARNARELLATTERVTINRRRSHSLRSGP